MGRGRQRAKDAKIARQIKYANNGSDLKALERELVSGHPDVIPVAAANDLEPEIDPIGAWDPDVDDEWSDR